MYLMFFTKSKKIVSLASAIAIIAACGGTAFASPQDISQTANDTTFDFNSILLEDNVTTEVLPANAVGFACVMDAAMEISDITFCNMQEGSELFPIGMIDPENISGGVATEALPANEVGLACMMSADAETSDMDFSRIQ